MNPDAVLSGGGARRPRRRRVAAATTPLWLFRAGAMTAGTVFLLVYYVNLLSRPIRELAQQVDSLQSVGASVQRIRERACSMLMFGKTENVVFPTAPVGVSKALSS